MEKKETPEEYKARMKELRVLFRSKKGEMSIKRSSKNKKEAILEKTLKKIGIDKDKFKSDLEAVKKQGGFEINIK